MITLAIDPGITKANHTGWALFDDEELLEIGDIEFTNTGLERIASVREEFKKLFEKYDIDVLAIEKPYGPNPNSLKPVYIFFGTILSTCLDYEIKSYDYYHPAHIKKVVTGDGRASKDDINDYIRDFYDITDEVQKDTADAVAIGLCAIRDLREENA